MSDVAPDERQIPGEQRREAGNVAEDPASPAPATSTFRALRIWPAGLLLVCVWTLKLLIPFVDSSVLSRPMLFAWFLGPLVCTGLILLWWLFASRATMKEKTLGFVGVAAIAVITTLLADESLLGAGTMLYTVPWGISGFTIVLICLARWVSISRTWLALLAALACFGIWDLVRIDTMWGDLHASFSWRWEPTAEELFMRGAAARSQKPTGAAPVAEQSLAEPEWPGFRGPHRNGVQPGIVLAEDWNSRPPREIWRVRVGPGWSSFAVAGIHLFTQEQRGNNEVVVCYDANSGAERWVHLQTARFWEAMGGAGPRATPTLADGKLFTLGATGLLHRLDPLTGKQVWQRDISADAGREPPMWGFASSPLVTHGVVVVQAGGPDENGMLAYDVETGDLRWTSPSGDHSYSSPQLSVVDGKQCVLMLTNMGITFVDPADGQLLGKHDWPYSGYRVLQPLLLDDSSVLLGSGIGAGTQRIKVRWDKSRFVAEQEWESRNMSPEFNDSVAHDGYLYGFDKNIFACVDIATGKRQWKKGRYGNCQVLLLPSGDQILVMSEDGELILLRASPSELVELTRHRVLEGRTWNHPVLVANRLYVRNGEEAACFEMPTL